MLGSVFNRNQGASGITSHLRDFKHNRETNGFSEFQGPVPPAAELGSPGDIYIDTTEGKHALYARYPNEWKEWCGMRAGTIDTSPIPHPHIPSRVLGIMVNSSKISWFSKGKATESSINPSDVIATVLAGRQVKKRKRGSTSDAMESAKRMRTTLSEIPCSSTNAVASSSAPSTCVVEPSQFPTRIFLDSNIYNPSYQPMIELSPITMLPPVDDRRTPILARQDIVSSHESTDSYQPGPTDDGVNLPRSLKRRPPDTPVKLDLRSISKRRSASGTNKMMISPMKPSPVLPSLDDGIAIRQRLNSDSSRQIDSHFQHRISASPSQGPNTTDHVTAQSRSVLPGFAIEPPTVLALSHTGETCVIDVAAVLAEVMRLREENVELAKIKRDNALMVKLLASYPSTMPPDHHVADANLPTEFQSQTQTPMDIPEQGENADEHRLSSHPRDDNKEQVFGEDTLGEPSPSVAEGPPTEELDNFKGQEHYRLSSPTTVSFDESRESDQVDELEESGSETIDNEAAGGEDNPSSPHLSIPIRGDANDSGNETIQRGEVDLLPKSPPSDLRNVDADDALETGSPPPIGADLSKLNSHDPTEDANNFSTPSNQHKYSSPKPNILVVKQEVVSPPSVRRTHPPFYPADQEIIDLTLDDDDLFVPDDPDAQEPSSANLEPSTPNSLFSSRTITSPNILEQPLESPSPDTRDISDEIDAERPSPPLKSQNLDVEEDGTTTQTSIEQDSSTRKSPAHAFSYPEKSHLLPNDDQSHGPNIETPPSNAPTRHNNPRPESPTMLQDVEVKEESALMESGLLDDANWLTTAHLKVIFDEKCVPNAFLCRLCLASEPTKKFQRGSGTSRFELRKHCTDEHWDACETLRNLEHDQLLHIFDNLSENNPNPST